MFSLQEKVEQILLNASREVLRGMIRTKTKSLGITLSEREMKQIEKIICVGKGGNFTLRRRKQKKKQTLTLKFSSQDVAELEEVSKRLFDKLPQIVEEASSKAVPVVLRAFERRWSRENRAQQHIQDRFQERLMRRWGKPLSLMRMLLVLALEFGSVLNGEARRNSTIPRTVDVLTRLHARACQVTDEVICLLSAGFADGAIARWRTLFEIATVAFLISRFGEEMAERYLAHDVVETYRAAMQLQEYAARIGYEPYSESELKAFKENYDTAILKYGRSFAGSYGWAAKQLNMNDPKLNDLIDQSEIGHLRPYYKMASHNVHSNPKGVLVKLGLYGNQSTVLLAGPSNFGLADPGNFTALSLTQISMALLGLSPTLDNVLCVQVMQALLGNIGKAFAQVHESVVNVARSGAVSA